MNHEQEIHRHLENAIPEYIYKAKNVKESVESALEHK